MLGDHGRRLDLTQQTGIGVERDPLRILLDPKTDTELPNRTSEVGRVDLVE